MIQTAQKAVCFVEQKFVTQGIERKPTNMRCPHGEPADALYFAQQSDLDRFADTYPHAAYEADIKPSDRFLMERFIQGEAEIFGHWAYEKGCWVSHNAQLKPGNATTPLSALSIDIETGLGSPAPLLSIGVQIGDNSCVFMARSAPDDVSETDIMIKWCHSERDTLQQAFAWICGHDPDLLIGWNVIDFDLRFLEKKCNELGVPFAIGRYEQSARVLDARNAGQPRVARVPGRAVLDGVDLLRAAFWQFDSFALDNVAHELLGERKLIQSHGLDKVKTIAEQFKHAPQQLAEYNLKDCVLVSRIFEKADLFNFARQRSLMTGLAIDRIGGSVAAFDFLYLPRLHRHGKVARSMAQLPQAENSPGGYVLDSTPGFYRNVMLLDFKSLYPSIIRTFLIDPAGLTDETDNTVPGFKGAYFRRDAALLPAIIAELWQLRDQAKAERNAALSQAIKIIMNSFYGVLGSSGCRFFDPKLASSITLRGKEIITTSKAWFEARGHAVIYGDTDSLFVTLPEDWTRQHCVEYGEKLKCDINQHWQQTLRDTMGLTSHLELEFETLFDRFWMPTIRHSEAGSKKRYAGLVNSGPEEQLVIKGLESVRSDWTPLAKSFQRELLQRVFHDQPIEQYCRDIYQQLIDGQLDSELVYSKRIRRPLESYQKNVPPHIQAARKIPKPGRKIQYLITLAGPEPIGHLSQAIDYQHYATRQLAPIADALLQSTTFSMINDAQMHLF